MRQSKILTSKAEGVKMKTIKKITVILLLIAALATLSGCVVKVPIPEIEEGRFDFSVTYEINGEVKTYTGVYVCSFDGVLTTLIGSSLEWKGYIENEKEEDIPIHTNDVGVVYINCGFFPEYFMGDPDAAYYESPTPNLYLLYHGSTADDLDITSDEEVIAELGVKLIGWEYADPIENSFKEKTTLSRFEPSIN